MKTERGFRIHKFSIDRKTHKIRFYLTSGITISITLTTIIISILSNGEEILILDNPKIFLCYNFMVFITAISHRAAYSTNILYIGNRGIEIYPDNLKIPYQEIEKIRTKYFSLSSDIHLKTKTGKFKFIPSLIIWTGNDVLIRTHGLDKDKLLYLLTHYFQNRQKSA